MPLERWPDFEGAGIYYAAIELEARGYAGSPVTVVGGANSAGQAGLYLAGRGSEVSLVVRGPDIATEMSAYLVDRHIPGADRPGSSWVTLCLAGGSQAVIARAEVAGFVR